MRKPSMGTRGSGKVVGMVMLLVFGGLGLWYVAYRAAATQQKRAAAKEQAVQGTKTGFANEEERIAYVAKHVAVTDLQLVPDTKPDSDEIVPGLFRVTGIVVNNGDQKLDKIILSVYPENAQGEVIGSYVENIAGAKGLEPGGTHDFKFQVPEKKEYGGKFRHTVR
jgi:hypothetical protein